MSGAAVLGAFLSFAEPSGQAVELSVLLSKPASVAFSLDRHPPVTRGEARRHRFGPWPLPRGERRAFRLRVAGGDALSGAVPDFGARPLRVALIGGLRDAPGSTKDLGPYRGLLERIAPWAPHVVVYLGPSGPRLRVGRALFSRTVVLAGPSASVAGCPEGGAVRIGPSLFLFPGGPEVPPEDRSLLRFSVLEDRVFSPRRAAALAGRLDLAAVFFGRVSHYERFSSGKSALFLSGGASAALEPPRRRVAGSAGALLAHHWLRLALFDAGAVVEAESLDGLTLDRVELPLAAASAAKKGRPEGALVCLGALCFGLFAALLRILRPHDPPA